MLVAGDELGRTQDGNNNAYCQDNPISWVDWDGRDDMLCGFASKLIELRRTHPALRRLTWFDGSLSLMGERDIAWLWRNGAEITREQWEDRANRCFGFRIGREHAWEAALVALINASGAEVVFTLPPPPGGVWELLIDTAHGDLPLPHISGAAESVVVPARAMLLFSSAPGAT
jgi:glycogen operon protein